jgi:preprotein translocase subunit YajC
MMFRTLPRGRTPVPGALIGVLCVRAAHIETAGSGRTIRSLVPDPGITPCNAAPAHIGSGQISRALRRAPTPDPRTPMEAIQQFVPLILIFAIMYFLLIRPQQKKVKEHQAMVAALRRGDMVVTQGGIIGKVSKVKDDGELEIEIADNVRVRVMRATIVQVLSKTEPAAA